MEKIRVLLVDDHQIMLDGIKALLGGSSAFEIVGEATRCPQALQMIPHCQPDIIITDLHLPEMNGVAFTLELKKQHPEIKVMVLSMSDDAGIISDAVAAGINGYVVKNTGKEELEGALMRISKGEKYFSPDIATILAGQLNNKSRPESHQAKLTQREIEIVQLIAKEYSNEQIANALFISERTVETHRKNIFRKTETKGVIGLLKYAAEHRII